VIVSIRGWIFCIQRGHVQESQDDLQLRPIHHQLEHRIEALIDNTPPSLATVADDATSSSPGGAVSRLG
jgi:hypothetical protein